MVQTSPGNDCLRARRSGEDVPNCPTVSHRQRNFLTSDLSACRAIALAKAKLSWPRWQTPALSPAHRRTASLTSDSMFARATKGDVTPVGEKFCEILRLCSHTHSVKLGAKAIAVDLL